MVSKTESDFVAKMIVECYLSIAQMILDKATEIDPTHNHKYISTRKK